MGELVLCPNGCGEKLFPKEISAHVRASCPDRKELCDCGMLIRYRERNKHKMLFCDLRQVQCKYAPKCKWRGTARDLHVHLSETLSTEQKMAKVKGDPFIECLERPYTCWHPPLVAPNEEVGQGGFRIRWTGCGQMFRFSRRQEHDSKECPFRLELCKLGCGVHIVGWQLEEHYQGKPLKYCRDTLEWVHSGCPRRKVPCVYVIAKQRKKPLDEGEVGDEEEAKVPDSQIKRVPSSINHVASQVGEEQAGGEGGAAVAGGSSASDAPNLFRTESQGALMRVPSQTNGRRERRESTLMRRHSLLEGNDFPLLEAHHFYSQAEKEKNISVYRSVCVRCEDGCGAHFTAAELNDHQLSECQERFVLCKHGCGELVKSKHMAEHEDNAHQIVTDLHLAASDGNLERCKDHLWGRDGVRKFRIHCTDEHGNNVVHYAVEGNNMQVLTLFIEHKADVNVKGTNGFTPLMLAAVENKVPAMDVLIKAKADLNVRDTQLGWSALHHSAFLRHTESAMTLVKQRCELDVTDTRRGDTALMLALVAEAEDVATILVRAGASVNVRNNRTAKTFYHTFSQSSGKPQLVERGDVAHDYSRSEDMRSITIPDLNAELAQVSKTLGLDPLYGSRFHTSDAKHRVSPEKGRAAGQSLSPGRPKTAEGDEGEMAATNRRDRLSPTKPQTVARASRTQIL